jgi:hypothetical protein
MQSISVDRGDRKRTPHDQAKFLQAIASKAHYLFIIGFLDAAC